MKRKVHKLLLLRVDDITRAVSATLHSPQLGGPRCYRGQKFSPVTT